MDEYIERKEAAQNESICRSCFHSYVCEQFNEHRDSDNKKCHFFNDHFVPAADVVEVVRCKDCKHWNNGYCCGVPLVGDDASYVATEETDYCSYGEAKMDGKGDTNV